MFLFCLPRNRIPSIAFTCSRTRIIASSCANRIEAERRHNMSHLRARWRHSVWEDQLRQYLSTTKIQRRGHARSRGKVTRKRSLRPTGCVCWERMWLWGAFGAADIIIYESKPLLALCKWCIVGRGSGEAALCLQNSDSSRREQFGMSGKTEWQSMRAWKLLSQDSWTGVDSLESWKGGGGGGS